MSLANKVKDAAGDYNIKPGKALKVLVVLAMLIAFTAWFMLKSMYTLDRDEYRILVKKYGATHQPVEGEDPNKDIVAADANHNGIQKELLTGQGYHFVNPITTEVIKGPNESCKPIEVPNGKIAILTHLSGKPIPPDQVLAIKDDEKGILEKIYKQGERLYYNPYEYTHKFYHPDQKEGQPPAEFADIVVIKPGERGVVTRLVGKNPDDPNVFVVKEGERGTQPFLLSEGAYPEYSHPFVWKVIPIDVRSERCEMRDQTAVHLITADGFDVTLWVFIEWAPILEMLPQTFVKFYDEETEENRKSGGMSNLEKELILPNARSLLRIEGSKFRGDAFITEDLAVVVAEPPTTGPAATSKPAEKKSLYGIQEDVAEQLKAICRKQGAEIRSFVITKTIPSPALQEQFGRREIAARKIEQLKKEIEAEVGDMKILASTRPSTMPSGGRLAQIIEQRRKDREEKFGTNRQEIAKKVRAAEQYARVEITKSQKELEVAKLDLQAARDKAAKTRAEGLAQAEVTVMKNKAAAEGIKQNVAAFGTGDKYAEFLLIKKFVPSVHQILSNTDGPFADFFLKLMQADEKNKADKK